MWQAISKFININGVQLPCHLAKSAGQICYNCLKNGIDINTMGQKNLFVARRKGDFKRKIVEWGFGHSVLAACDVWRIINILKDNTAYNIQQNQQ